jgi:TonB family protein
MTLSAGARLGPYEIVSRAGAGGMGEVWKARDTRLDRTVAVKVLPPDVPSAARWRSAPPPHSRSIACHAAGAWLNIVARYGAVAVLLAAWGTAAGAEPQEVDSLVHACGQITMLNCDQAGAVSWLLDLGAPDVLSVSAETVSERAAVVEIARHHGFGRLCVSGRLVRKNAPFEVALVEVDALREIKPEGEPVPDPLGPDVSRTCDPGVRLPTVVKEQRPNYTREALGAGIQGAVWVEAVVAIDGKVSKVRVVRSIDRRRGLDNEAVAAAKRWRFNPGTKNGQPVAMAVIIELSFRIKGKPRGDDSR